MLGDEDLDVLCLVRAFETRLLALYDEGLIGGTTHTCLGQEPAAVALSALITPDDFVFSTHRGHGHYLAATRDLDGLLAEIMGREGGVSRGYGGSQHLHAQRFFTTGVQGAGVGTAVGAALRARTAGETTLAIAFTGDGTWGQGLVYESLNLACLYRLPLVVVTEINGMAQSTRTRDSIAGSIPGRARAIGARCVELSGFDVDGARSVLAPVLREVRAGAGPLVVSWELPRLGPHSKGDDTRSRDELEQLRHLDWFEAARRQHPDRADAAMVRATARVEAVVAEVAARPLASALER